MILLKIKSAARWTSSLLRGMGRWIWTHGNRLLPLTLLVVFAWLALDWLVIYSTPDSRYLQYTQLTVEDSTAGQQALATICRNAEDSYETEGSVAFYIVDKDGHKVFNSEEDFPMTIAKSNSCIKEHIPTQKLRPGIYELVLYRQFQVDTTVGIPVAKKADYRSNTFTVVDEMRSIEDVTKKILELERQIEELRARAGELIPGFAVINSTPNQTIINNTYIQDQASDQSQTKSSVNGKATAPGQLKK